LNGTRVFGHALDWWKLISKRRSEKYAQVHGNIPKSVKAMNLKLKDNFLHKIKSPPEFSVWAFLKFTWL
jgi:hypothetical protein